MTHAADLRDYVSLPQAARMLSMSWTRAYRLVLMNELPSELRHGRYLIPRVALERYAQERGVAITKENA